MKVRANGINSWSRVLNGRSLGMLFLYWSVMAATLAQTPIQGVINSATRVTAYDPCINGLTAANTTGFFTGQKVMIIQMKVAFSTVINTANNASFGQLTNPNTPVGNYEFNRIQSITGNTIVLNHPLTRQYEFIDGVVQLVTVPEYLGGAGVNVSGVLQPPAWDPNTNSGGILVFETDGPVTLNANINANGRGFTGGARIEDGSNGGACLGDFSFSTTVPGGGFKGESPVLPWQFMALGKGPWWSGGGGGNNHNNGGGGGGNGGTGGRGGVWANCDDPNVTAGIGGYNHPYAAAQNKLYLGSGGGGGDSNNGCGTNGGDGGGLVLIIAPSINGNGNAIRANGANAPGVSCSGSSDGGGGGGAGGTIFLACPVINNITLEARGGAGANNNANSSEHGTGGGGAGGAVLATGGLGGATIQVGGGAAGLCQNNSCNGPTNLAQPGNPGISQSGWQVPPIDPFVYTPLQATATPSPALCAGTATGSISTTVSGGFPPYTFLWNPGGSTAQNPTGLVAGTYTGQIRDSRQCLVTVTPIIVQPPALNVTFTKTDNGCKGLAEGTITVSASGGTPGYTYTWGDIGTGPANRANLPAGTYTVVVTDQNGCAFPTQNIVINEPPTGLTASPTQQNIACFVNGSNALGSINLNISGAIGATNITWNPASISGANPTNLPPGTYSYTVTDQTPCPAIGTITLTGPTQPLAVSLVSKQDISCNGLSNGQITVTASGGVGTLTFDWGNGITGPVRTGLSAGSYTVTVRDANNCTVTLTTTLVQPTVLTASATGTNIKCFGESTGSVDASIAGGTPPYSYAWLPLNQTTQDIFGLSAGTYNLTVTDAQGCTATASATLVQPAAGLAINLTPTNIKCFGESTGSVDAAVAGGSPPYSYAWLPLNQTTQDIFGLAAGTYNLTITDAQGCTATASATLVQPASGLALNLTPTNIQCFGAGDGSIQSLTTGGTPAYTYAWTGPNGFSSTQPNLGNLQPGTYNLIVTDAQSCTATASATLVQPTVLTASATGTNVKCFGESTGSVDASIAGGTPPYSYAWLPLNQTTQDIFGLSAGTYNLTVTDAQGCTATASATLGEPASGLALNLTPTDISCFGFGDGTIQSLASGGTPAYIYAWAGPSGFSSSQPNLANLQPGAYTLTLTDANACTITASVTLTQPAEVIVDFTTANVCFPTAVAFFDASSYGGTFTSSVWDFDDDGTPDFSAPGLSSPSFAYPAPGRYTVRLTVTTDANCVYTRTRQVTVHPKPTAAFDAPPVCLQAPTLFNAGASNVLNTPTLPNTITSYSWDFDSDGTVDQTTSGPTVNHTYATDGTYTATLVVATNNGCRDTVALPVVVYPIPIPEFAVADNCHTFPTSFDASGTTLNPPGIIQTYEWDFDGNGTIDATGINPNHTYPAPSTYTPRLRVTTTDGCVRTTTRSVTIHPLPVMALSTQSVCQGTPTAYTAALSSIQTGSIVEYEWDFENNGIIDTVTTIPFASIIYPDSGLFTARVTGVSDQGCRTSATFTTRVRPNPDARFSIDKFNACVGELVQFSYTGVPIIGQILTWDFGAGIINSSLNQTYNVSFPSFPDSVGTFPISLTAISEGCTTVVSQTVRIYRIPTVDAGPDVAICKGERIELTGAALNPSAGNCQYLWVPLNASVSTIISGQTDLTVQVAPEDTTDYQLIAICNGCTSTPDIVRVFVATPPVLVLDSTEVSLCTGSTGVALTSSIFGGVPGYAYYWAPADGLDPFSPEPIALPTQTTTYTVFVVDSMGCRSNDAQILVRVRALPVADAGPDKAYCAGLQQGVQLNGQVANPDTTSIDSYSYEWFPKQGLSNPFIANPFATPDNTTIYTLIVKDKYGCTSANTTLDPLSTVVVEVRPRPIADAGPDTLYRCPGQGVRIGGVPTNAGPGYTYFWTPADGLIDPNTGQPSNTIARPLASPNTNIQTYFLIVSSNGCSSEPDFVTVITQPSPTVFVEKLRSVCPGDSATFAGTFSPATGTYTWQWNPATGLSDPKAFLPKAAPKTTTTYSLTYTYNGCTFVADTVRVEVRPVPIVRASADGLARQLCPNSGESIDLDGFIDGGGQEVSFEWTPNIGFETGGNFTLNPLVRPTETTTYTLTARLAASGCEVRDSITVYVLPGVSAEIEASDTALCAGQTLTLKARGGIGGAQYFWRWTDSLGNTGSAQGQILELKPQATTRYILEVSEGGCRSRDTLTVQVGLAAVPAFAASVQRGCSGLTVLFENRSIGFPGGFTWDFGDGSISSNDRNPVHTYTRPGTYTVRLNILTTTGCLYTSDSVRITIGGLEQPDFTSLPPYPAEQILDTAVVQFVGIRTEGAVSYFWNFGDGTTSTQPSPIHEYQAAGTYSVTLTIVDSVGCVYTIEHGPYVVRNPELEVHNVFTPNGDGINDRWKPFYDGTRPYNAIVFDRWGIQLYQFNEADAGWDGAHNGNPAPSGTYFYLIQIHHRTIQGHLTLVR